MMTPSFDAADAFGALATTESLTDDQIEERAQALLDQLTLDEKIALMDGDPPFWPGLADMFAGGYNKHTWVAGAVPRLGIPGVRFSDGPRGVVMQGATTFPVSMARGATWDPALEERVGEAIGRELRALGGNYFGGVCINLLRHPAWGRAQETYGEDPHHLGALGVVERGEVPLERVDDAALRVLRQQVRFGQGRDPRDYGPEVVGCEAHRQLAREVAQKSIVLLKSEGGLLPLRGVRRLAVIGRLA